jgi:hypothetical protein
MLRNRCVQFNGRKQRLDGRKKAQEPHTEEDLASMSLTRWLMAPGAANN